MWKLKYPVQCQDCPWRIDSNLADIPQYSHNQVNDGNSICARVAMFFCENARDLQVIGDQFEALEQTFRQLR